MNQVFDGGGDHISSIYIQLGSRRIAEVSGYRASPRDDDSYYLALDHVYLTDDAIRGGVWFEHIDGFTLVVEKLDGNIKYCDCYLQATYGLSRGHAERMWATSFQRTEVAYD